MSGLLSLIQLWLSCRQLNRWFCDERWHDLLVIMDDAISEIYSAQLVAEESTVSVMSGLREVIEQQGTTETVPLEAPVHKPGFRS